MNLPNCHLKKIYECRSCGHVSIKFWNPHYDRTYTKEEWRTILSEGLQALRKILGPVTDDPKFFSN